MLKYIKDNISIRIKKCLHCLLNIMYGCKCNEKKANFKELSMNAGKNHLQSDLQRSFRVKFILTSILSILAICVMPLNSIAHLQDSVWVVTFTPGESVDSKLKKAAHVRPSPAQIKWMERERNAFIHYGMNTFHGADWGSGSENPKDFAPTAQDAKQWAKVLKDAKFSMVVPTAKHHDGFCIWNTATTNHCVKSAAVTTDVIEELYNGCTDQGVSLGIYLSPWDMNQDKAGTWKIDTYNTLFVSQLKELLGGKYGAKGTIGELWFDGACGSLPIWQPASWYRVNVWYDTIEAMQPNAVIRLYDGFYFADESRWSGIQQGTQKLQWRGKELRWCGNEGGTGRADEWCVQPVWTRFFGSEQQKNDLGQESYYNTAIGAVWYQSEVNTSIADGGQWFWHNGGYALKSLNMMKTLFYNSIGNSSNLLLNLLPDNRGLIADDQARLLKNWNNWIDSSFTKNYAKGATASATAEAPGHEADKIIDNKRHTYWTTSGNWNIGSSTASITFDLKTPQTFDHVMIKEYVYNGQRVAGWNLEYQDGSTWKSLITGKKVIGYKRILKFNQVTSSKVRLNITRSWDNPEISNFALYRTLSGVDTEQEDTSSGITAVAPQPVLKSISSTSLQPRISVNSSRLTIDGMGLSVDHIELLRPDGRVVPISIINSSHISSQPLARGTYVARIISGDRIFVKQVIVTP
jgi:alpha-L-fucosidase